MEKEQVWIMRKHWPLLATFVTGFILSQLVFPQRTETRWMTEEVTREVQVEAATVVSSQMATAAVEKRNVRTTETTEPVLLGLDGSGSPIVEFRHQITLTDLSFLEQDTATHSTVSEMSNTSSFVSEKAVMVSSRESLTRYRVSIGIADTWVPASTAKCVTGASGWLGCAELLELGASARLGDSPIWLGARLGLRRWAFEASMEFGP